MKKQFLLFFSFCFLSLGLLAQTTVNMPNSDGSQKTVSVTEPVTFYDAGGETDDIPKWKTTGITFEPRVGEVIEITFETIDLQGGSLIKIFDGKKTLSEDYDDLEQETTYTIPSGHRVAYAGTKTNQTVRSLSSDGKLTVCFQNSNGSGTGWKATVKSITRPAVVPEEATGDVSMSLEPKIYIISQPTNFYDDGGKNGKISQNYDGKIIFRPKTNGKKLKVTFKKLALFNTSSTGKNDILKIYSGEETIESNLLASLLKEPTPIVLKSTAEDGSLTVTLKSTTGLAKDGFEAVVEEFESQPMTFNEIALAQITNGTIGAGDKNQAILSVNIKTNNDLSPLNVSKFSFTTNSTYQNIEKATLYYTKGDDKFSTTTKVGATAVTADIFEITCTTPQDLSEGNNYFWLAYDIKATAQNGLIIDAGCTAVTVSELEKTVANPQPKGNRVVKNEYISTIGTFEKTIYGDWSFTHTPNPYGNGYKAENGNQIITFKPGEAGKVVQIDFADFDVYYSSSSYGTKANFIIYNGTGTSGEKLWEADATNKATGPDKVIRSTASDGSLTILFNANTSYSYNNGKGWHATVSQYQSVPMNFVGLNVTQTNTEITKPSATNEEIIGFEIETTGDLSPLTLNEIVLNLKGSHDKIKKVSIFKSDNEAFATTTLVAENLNPTADAVSLAPSTPITLAEGKNYFWVTYDMNDDLTSGQTVDAALTSVKIGSEVKTPANGDPAGERIIKNIYIMQSGTHTVNVSSTMMFYDNGGADNKYEKGNKETVTFIPKAGQVIKLDFKSFTTGYRDYLYVYNGNSELAPEIAKLKGRDLPKPILSSSEDGSLTVSFTPTARYNNDGWEIEVSSYTPQPLSIASIKSTAVSSEKLLKGSTDEQMLKVEIEVVGDKGNLDFTAFDFTAESTTQTSDIASANLYFTDTLSTFSNIKKYAETITNNPLNFRGHTSIGKAGIYNFWLTYNITPTATIGNKIEAKLTNVELANTVQTIAENNTASRKLAAGFSGTYSVGTETADYPTLSEAIKAMESGIDGKVVFNIENGTYDELIKIPHVKGASSENTIIIQSRSGNYQDVTFEVNRYSNPAYGEDKNGMFTVYGADYITIKGISFKTTAAFPSVVNIKNISNYVTIDNCFIKAPISTSYSGTVLIETEAGKEAYTNNDYFTIKNSILEGGRVGINIGGTGYVKLPKQKGAKIVGNTFHNQGAMSVYMQKEHDGIIDGNTITINGETAYQFKAIDAVMIGNTIIRNNKINISASKSIIGLYLRERDENETLEGRNHIYNNELIITSTSTNGRDNVAGIEFADAGISNTDIVYNSINILNANISRVATIYLSNRKGTPKSNVIKNNILQNNAGKYVYYFLNSELLSGFAFANNALYTSGAKLAYAGNDIATFEDWKTASSATNSINEQAQFLSDTSLDLKAKGNLLTAMPVDFVTTDINGTTRNNNTPTIGAYEYQEIAMPMFNENYPVIENITHNTAKAKVKITENGKIFFLVKKANETAPTQDEVLAGTSASLTKNTEVKLDVTDLEAQTEYKVYFVLQSLSPESSTVIKSQTFTTSYLPTEVSTFEKVTATSGDFSDGTADFAGFVVEEITDGQGTNNHKAAKMTASSATVTINNNNQGLILNGFYFKSNVSVELNAKKATTATINKSLEATNGKWVFINLKDMGEITSVEFAGTGNIYIDNFCGEPQPITFMLEDKKVNFDQTVSIESDIYGGVLPYTYVWKNKTDETLSTEATLTFQPKNTTQVTLTVTDAWGNSFSNSSLVTVIGKSAVATFDDLTLAPESRWWGDNTSATNYSTFYSGSYAFSNMLIEKWQTWGGFAYSNKTSTEYNSLQDQFNSAVGHGVNNSSNYAVVYTLGIPTNVSVTHSLEGDSISGFYITNTAWVKNVSENGTGLPSNDDPTGKKAFGKGDWYKITAEGDNGKSVDFYLADYRSENPEDHYTLNSWQWFDLRTLGKVKKVTFKADGTRKNSKGSTIPFYFCMDDLGGERNFVTSNEKLISKNKTKIIDLATLFPSNRSIQVATVTYKITDMPNSNIATAEITDNNLSVKGIKEGKTNIVVSKTEKGVTQFAKLTLKISIPSGLSNTSDNVSYNIYPNPAVNYFNINANGVLEIYNTNGAKVYRNDNYTANSNIDISNYTKGLYMIVINGNSMKLIKK